LERQRRSQNYPTPRHIVMTSLGRAWKLIKSSEIKKPSNVGLGEAQVMKMQV